MILADVQTRSSAPGQLTCGLGGVRGVVMFLRNCPGIGLSATASWGSAASFTIAHELVHGLGAVADCAPNSSGDGHVTDEPRSTTVPVVLDGGRDDYFSHGVPGCPDIADSPLWGR
ncbi:hypothetical protein BH23ACT9_BH23ACT9_20640 [soil metagenome]